MGEHKMLIDEIEFILKPDKVTAERQRGRRECYRGSGLDTLHRKAYLT